jgi:hypothetical protein
MKKNCITILLNDTLIRNFKSKLYPRSAPSARSRLDTHYGQRSGNPGQHSRMPAQRTEFSRMLQFDNSWTYGLLLGGHIIIETLG